jgi:hypothetical protein
MLLYLSDKNPKTPEIAALLKEALESEGFAVHKMKSNVGKQSTYAAIENHYLKVGGTA